MERDTSMKSALIVDDDKTNLKIAEITLKAFCDVTGVESGYEALTLLDKNKFDILLLDIKMPDLDGFETLHFIREKENGIDTPVIFLTADNDANTETKCFHEGAVDFISKPFLPEVLRQRVGRILEIEEFRQHLSEKLERTTIEAAKIKIDALKDPLTGLWNRAFTEDAINSHLLSSGNGTFFMMDMDNFKQINDNYGHATGDKVLSIFSDILLRFASEDDICCRLSGDEFIVYFRNLTERKDVELKAKGIIHEMNKKIANLNICIDTSVSSGIAVAPEDGTNFTILYTNADKALYFIKQNGKKSFHFFRDQRNAERVRAEMKSGLEYLNAIMRRNDDNRGSYFVEYDSFHYIYNYIKRSIDRNHRDVQVVLFTVNLTNENKNVEHPKVEKAVEALSAAIADFLNREDVSTKYSSNQLIILLMDADNTKAEAVIRRILNQFDSLYQNRDIRIEFGMAQM